MGADKVLTTSTSPNDQALLVTVVVPVYNAEKHLRKCIESILAQTHQYLQLILVNDGSTDASGSICAEYALHDERIVYYSKDNGGVSSSRNVGMLLANGEYLLFVDADDYIENNMVEELLSSIVNSGADMLIHGLISESEEGTTLSNKECSAFVASTFKEKQDALAYLQGEGLLGFACNKLYKLSLLREHGIAYAMDINLYEDLLFNLECFRHSETICGINVKKYHYVYRRDSLSNKQNDSRMQHTERLLCELDSILSDYLVSDCIADVLMFNFTIASVRGYLQTIGTITREAIKHSLDVIQGYHRITQSLAWHSECGRITNFRNRFYARTIQKGSTFLIIAMLALERGVNAIRHFARKKHTI